MKEAQERIEKALQKLRQAGVRISSYTVYPGKGTVKANVTVEVKDERKEAQHLRKV